MTLMGSNLSLWKGKFQVYNMADVSINGVVLICDIKRNMGTQNIGDIAYASGLGNIEN